MAQVEIAAFDPMDAFVSTLKNLIEITDVFAEGEDLPPLDFLRATNHARETFAAITHILMLTQLGRVSERIPDEARAAFDAENTARELARTESAESRNAHLKKLMRPFMIEFPMLDTDDMPDGMFGDDDV